MAGLLTARLTLAVCPVCTIAIAGGLGLSRWLGVDDTVSGVWIGGLIISSVIWFLDWLNKKQIRFKFRWFIITAFSYLIIILPLYWSKIIGHPDNKFLGIDKLIFGIIAGSLVFFLGDYLSNFLKSKNQGKAFFRFQKLILPISLLIIFSTVFYFIIKYEIIK